MSASHEFYSAQRAWTKRLRSVRTLTWQQGRVAWALGEFFSARHGIAYPRFDLIGERAGGVDRRDVSRAIAALLAVRCIGEATHADVAAAAAADGIAEIGGRLRGFRMVLDTEETVAGWVAALVAFAALEGNLPRVRRARSKGATPPFVKGGTVAPLAMQGHRGQNEVLSGAKVVPIGGTYAPQTDRTEDARSARASITSVHNLRSEEVPKGRAIGADRAPKGAVLTDDHLELAEICFGVLSDDDLVNLETLASQIGIQRFAVELVNLNLSTDCTVLRVYDWVERIDRFVPRVSRHS